MTPYAPPTSHFEDPKESSSSATAIFVGAAVGNGTVYAVLFLCSLVFMWYLRAQGVPPHELYMRAHESTSYLVFAHFVGFLCCVPGGYWGARLGQEKPYLIAFLAGSVVAALSLVVNLMPYELPIPLWSRAASVLIPIPAFLLGAYRRPRLI